MATRKSQSNEVIQEGFSIPELSQRYGISQTKWWHEVHTGRLGHVRIGRRVVITRAQLDEYLNRNAASIFDPRAKAKNVSVKRGGN
ncbi:MAG: helix-turn-helix domain-containing protein [Candidatus Obscuribacterales bacterium]|nr:helix-turn-helix domain-containing protein [Candidatus Obscuribacterales bacterium]